MHLLRLKNAGVDRAAKSAGIYHNTYKKKPNIVLLCNTVLISLSSNFEMTGTSNLQRFNLKKDYYVFLYDYKHFVDCFSDFCDFSECF